MKNILLLMLLMSGMAFGQTQEDDITITINNTEYEVLNGIIHIPVAFDAGTLGPIVSETEIRRIVDGNITRFSGTMIGSYFVFSLPGVGEYQLEWVPGSSYGSRNLSAITLVSYDGVVREDMRIRIRNNAPFPTQPN